MGGFLFFIWINHHSSSLNSSRLISPSVQTASSSAALIHAQSKAQAPLPNASPALAGGSTAIRKNPSVVKEHSKPASGFDKGHPGIPTPDYLHAAGELSCTETKPDENEGQQGRSSKAQANGVWFFGSAEKVGGGGFDSMGILCVKDRGRQIQKVA